MAAFPQSGQKYGTDGNTLSTGDWIGSKNAMPIIIKTNNTQKAVFTSNGFFGLGIAAPTCIFDVFGDGKISNFNILSDLIVGNSLSTKKIFSPTGIVDFYGSKITTSNEIIAGKVTTPKIWSSSGTIDFDGCNIKTTASITGVSLAISGSSTFNSISASSFQNPLYAGTGNGIVTFDNNGNFQMLNFNGDANSVLFGNGAFGALPQLNFTAGNGITIEGNTISSLWTTNGDQLYNNTSRFIGICTENPQANLHLKGITDCTVHPPIPKRSTIFRIEDQVINNSQYALNRDVYWDITASALDRSLYFSNNGAGSITDVLTLYENGNVGIGNTDPTEKLEVQGNVKINGILNSQTISSQNFIDSALTGTGSGLLTFDNNGAFMPLNFNGDANTILHGDGTFGTLPSGGWALNGEDMYSLTHGNIGIGIETPIEKLDVNGNANIRGYLYVQDGVIIGKRIDGQKVTSDTILVDKIDVAKKLVTKELEAIKIRVDTFDVRRLSSGNLIIDGQNQTIISTTGLISFDDTRLATTGSIVAGDIEAGSIEADNITATNFNAGNLNIFGNNSRIESSTGNISFGNADLKTSGNITAGTMNISKVTVDSSVVNAMQVVNELKIGTHSLYLSSQVNPSGALNSIYTDEGDLRIQCESYPHNFNTIINAAEGMVGIGTGTDNLSAKLDVNGSFRLRDPNTQNGYILTSDANGFATWQPQVTHTGDVTGSDVLTIAVNAITSAKILDGEVTYSKLNSIGASTGQVLKFDGTNWMPAADNNTTFSLGTNTGLSLDGTILNSVWNVDGDKIYNNTTGSVGIGTNNPEKKLHVNTSEYVELPDADNQIEYSGSIRIQHDLTTGTDNHIFKSSIWDLEPLAFANGTNRFSIGTPGNTSMFSINGINGNIGIGTNDPKEKLEVNGGIRIGSTTTNNEGSIKFENGKFQGFDGNTWKNLSASAITEFTAAPNSLFYSDPSGHIQELSFSGQEFSTLRVNYNGTLTWDASTPIFQIAANTPLSVAGTGILRTLSISPNDFDHAGFVPMPGGNWMAWKTDGTGSPAWREDKQYEAGNNISFIQNGSSVYKINAASYNSGAGITVTETTETDQKNYTINSVWTKTSNNDIFSNTTGNVGIGTSTPVSKLHLHSTDVLQSLPNTNFQITNSFTGAVADRGLDLRLLWKGAFMLNHESGGLSFGTNNTLLLYLTADQKMGIGVTSPIEKLEVDGAIKIANTGNTSTAQNGTIVFDNNEFKGKVGTNWDVFNLWKKIGQGSDIYYGGGFVGIGTNQPNAPLHIVSPYAGMHFSNTDGTGLNIDVINQVTNLVSTGGLALQTGASQNFQIISSGPKFKIDVNGTTIVDKLLVRANNFSGEIKAKIDNTGNITCKKLTVQPNSAINIGDFVFDESYKMKSLYEEEQFYKQNKHLSNIPSAKEVSENGLDVFNFISLLLQKMEESTIHNVAQQKQIDTLSKQIETLQNTIKNLKK